MLGPTYLGDRKEREERNLGHNYEKTGTERLPNEARCRLPSFILTHKIHTRSMEMLTSEVDTNFSWMLECVVGVGGSFRFESFREFTANCAINPPGNNAVIFCPHLLLPELQLDRIFQLQKIQTLVLAQTQCGIHCCP